MNHLKSCIYYISEKQKLVYFSSSSESVSVIKLSKLLAMSPIITEGFLRREEVISNVCAVFVLVGVIKLLRVGVLTSIGGGRFQDNTTARQNSMMLILLLNFIVQMVGSWKGPVSRNVMRKEL